MEVFQKMKGKTAVITGAASGIGRATSHLLAAQGIKVALAGRNEEKGKQLEKELISLGAEALFIKTDVSSADSVKSFIQTTQESFGDIHYALNNAGIEGNLSLLTNMEESDFDEVISINLKGVWLCLKYELEAIAHENASIVNISTNITRKALPGTGVYTASKAGVEILTRVAAIEHEKKGVRINAIAPGAVDTPMIHRIYPDEKDFKNLSNQNPLGRMAYPEEIANTALWLFSSMSSHVNGDVILVDGGSSLV